jgi:predicted GNAT family acetyltransferase
MEVIRHKTATEFLDRAGSWMVQSEAENNLTLGITSSLIDHPQRHQGEPWLVTIEHDRGVVGTALMTPPRKLIITRSSTSAKKLLAEYLYHTHAPVPGVLGPAPDAHDFARCWGDLSGKEYRLEMRQRLYKCDRVLLPSCSPGRLRPAVATEQSLLARWCEQFYHDVGICGYADAATTVRAAIADRRLYVWEHDQVVSVASWARQTARNVAVNLVLQAARIASCTPTWPTPRQIASTRESDIDPSVTSRNGYSSNWMEKELFFLEDP